MWADFVNLIFPDRCRACQNNLNPKDNMICMRCRLTLPRTNYHLDVNNPVSKHFWGKTHLSYATAFLFFQKGDRVQHLIHQLKYKGDKEIGVVIGSLFGNALNATDTFSKATILIPVPLHSSRKHARGYNQSEMLAKGLAQKMNIPVNTKLLVRSQKTETQTNKRRYNRYENMRDVFEVISPHLYTNQHFLLVDDVITTGSTLVACADKLLTIEGASVSVAAMAFAQH
ncbi:MAG: ComF family protein [Bacteroidia bacterium]|nr:ComF family protein [Bacteroidia bacterium]HQV00816.1 ComF family protein [Bacteroidia bacterium]